MKHNSAMSTRSTSDQHPTFTRLMRAAEVRWGEEVASNQADVARRINELPQTLNVWRRRGVPYGKRGPLAKLLGVTFEWLDAGSGDMTVAAQQMPAALRDGNTNDLGGGYPLDARVPLYTWAELREIKNMKNKAKAKESIATPVLASSPGSFAVKIENDQFRSVPAGSFVIFAPGDAWHDGAIAIVRKNGNMVLRRLRSDGDMRLLIAHDDAPWQSEPFDPRKDEVLATKEVTILIDRK